jgi:hypothetical protein
MLGGLIFLADYIIYLIVPDHGRPSISGPIRSIKMYSWAQCTMQERCVVEMYPGWPKRSRDSAPSTLSTYPLPIHLW